MEKGGRRGEGAGSESSPALRTLEKSPLDIASAGRRTEGHSGASRVGSEIATIRAQEELPSSLSGAR